MTRRLLTREELAARAVAVHGPGTPADRKELLAALGLLGRDERSVVDPPKQPADMADLAAPASSYGRAGYLDQAESQLVTQRPKVSTAPPGLRDYTPVGPEPAQPRGRNNRFAPVTRTSRVA